MQLPSKLQELIEDPSVRDVVISGGYCGVDRGFGIFEIANQFTPEELEGELRQLASSLVFHVKTQEKLLLVMAQVWNLVVLSVKLSALGLAKSTSCLR